MPDFQPVTDPNILKQLNAAEVTDPAILEQLNAGPVTAPTKTVLQQLGNTWPARMVKDIYSAAKLPGDVLSGQTPVDVSNPEFMNRVTTLGGVAPVGVLPSAMAAAPSVKQLVQTGGQQIQGAVESGAVIPTQKLHEAIATIRQQLPDRRVAEDTHAALDALEQKVGPLTFKDFKQARDELMDVQANAARSTGRTAATDLRGATLAKHGLDEVVQDMPEGQQFITGNANVTGGKQAEALDKRLYRSELRASAANSGRNVGNTIRQNVASMLLSRDARGMSPDTIQQAEKIVYGSGPENFMRHWGNVLGGGGGLGQALTIAGSGGLGYLASGGSPTVAGVAATVGPVVGSLLKHGANEAALSHLEALSNSLRGNTPLGQIATRGNYFDGAMPSTTAAKAALIRALIAQQAQPPTQP